ncbi:hypothetical protein [Acinetobacter sp.]|jgi:hypothetical protein|uniref:hypothetical protein n=1 Tax=Acinetobacter sp. TaxID=472 RepID=UPI00333E4362
MKKLLFLAVLMGLTGCGDTDQNDTSQSTLQSSTASVNYRMAASSSALSAPSFGQWVVNGYASEGASTVVNASRMVGGVATESKALITPNVSQVSKILRAGLGGAALTFAVNELLDGIDWVMDPANNRVIYREPTTYPSGIYATTFSSGRDPVEVCKYAASQLGTTYKSFSVQGVDFYCHWEPTGHWVGIIQRTPPEEKNLTLDIVSQEIINNAESGNTDAQAVTLAAAQAMVSEAENDATKAKEIEDAFERNSDEKCKDHNFKMDSQAAIVQSRYNELYDDRFNLFINHKLVSNPLILNGKSKGSWDGHVSQYKYAQGILRNIIKTASYAGCPATPRADKWVNIEPPSQPGSSL